jgi:hypothetical protein
MEAASTAVPPAMAPQHMRALARANRVRLARAELKRAIKAEHIDPADIVRGCPWQVETMTVGELLRSQRRWGRARARKFLSSRTLQESLSLNENRELGRLTERQRNLLARALEAKASTAPRRQLLAA